MLVLHSSRYTDTSHMFTYNKAYHLKTVLFFVHFRVTLLLNESFWTISIFELVLVTLPSCAPDFLYDVAKTKHCVMLYKSANLKTALVIALFVSRLGSDVTLSLDVLKL